MGELKNAFTNHHYSSANCNFFVNEYRKIIVDFMKIPEVRVFSGIKDA